MPVFTEESSPEMLQRAAGLKKPPLPRVSSPAPVNVDRTADGAKHEVVIIGTGPAGIMLSLMLARYGVSCLPVEKVTSMIIPGQADGLQPRTLEVLRTLGLSEEVFSQGFPNHRMAFWNPGGPGEPRIVRTAVTDDVTVPTRYPHKVLLAAGRVVNILERQMNKYGNEVERGTEFLKYEFVGGEFPVRVFLRDVVTGREYSVFTKYLVGADGAHSKVREQMGVKLQGESTDYIWGVVDAVLKTDFPDIRKRCAIHSDAASIMAIPREMIEDQQYMTRLYTQLEDVVDATSTVANAASEQEAKARARERRQRVTLPRILDQVKKTMAPYDVEVVKVDWWAAYQIGQRVATKFAVQDSEGADRVFIMGDACHTHSPKAGQGMNVSMMDAFNLGWKLAFELLGLAPKGSLLPTYEFERRDIAEQLIAFDNAFASKFSQKMGDDGLSHEDFFKVFHTGCGFTSGCGIEYEQSSLVEKTLVKALDNSLNPDFGLLRSGRRLINIPVRRFSDDAPCEFHDVLPASGHYVVLVLLPKLFKDPRVQQQLTYLTSTLPQKFARGILEPFIIHPLRSNDDVEWNMFPKALKEDWEWNLLGDVSGQGYETFGVDRDAGVVAVLRPDGVLGGVWDIDELAPKRRVESYLAANLSARGTKSLL
ncbi:FAD binding domain-containing protein [Tricharina praecox]|uniref:FAD binding domain-containing protein n=1 Tax=Tricharina praecox TaxID=43433 RepID=UPI00221E59CE|nr:FAD binding domain-containing protein [Tricharina praecox]KAI5859228.1 FAD binding domain-containing protein [Tricharina praecox]